MNSVFTIKLALGSGRPFIVLYEAQSSAAVYAHAVSEQLAARTKVLLVEIPTITDNNWRSVSDDFLLFLKEQGIRQASFIGFHSACTLVYTTYLNEAKLVRTLVAVDSASRPHPTGASRFVDAVEKWFPLGLPLRAGSEGFDVRSHLQRIRCPVLVVVSPEASDFLVNEAHASNKAMPSSWFVRLPASDTIPEFCRIVEEFQEAPAKCPQ